MSTAQYINIANINLPGGETILSSNTNTAATQTEVDAVAQGAGTQAFNLKGTESIFNPFQIFRYAKYGNLSGEKYNVDYHKDRISQLGEGNSKGTLSLWGETKRDTIENPSASQIIEWAKNSVDSGSERILSRTPYSIYDFLYCKWYGKIPNNRLITLRRYPIPIEDNIQAAKEKMPLVPIAQAVTWFGGETQNKLNEILGGMSYGFKWKTPDPTADYQTIDGNEIELNKLLDKFGSSPNVSEENIAKLKKLAIALFNNDLAATSGLDQKAQTWLKEAWGNEGQYWNRVLGPVNVITSTKQRDRGYNFNNTIQLKFTYSLRSFNNTNPRIAMLDLISNFLSLTYNEAEFWGGAIRYFEKPGYTLTNIPNQDFENLKPVEGTVNVLKWLIGIVGEKSGEAKDFINILFKDIEGGNIEDAITKLTESRFVQNILGATTADLIPKFLRMKSFLDGRAVGEWHITVGNPMNPIAVIGNLCMTTTKIEFSESLGLDDFPTEVTFTVSLEPGRPRAKQDIESMFNLGGGSMYFSPLPPPSSAYNTFGEENSNIANRLNPDQDKFKTTEQPKTSIVNQEENEKWYGDLDPNKNSGYSKDAAQNLANEYGTRVTKAYGEKFGTSKALVDYFLDRKLKG